MSIKLEDLKLIPWNDELLVRKPKLFDFQEHDAQHVCDTLFEKGPRTHPSWPPSGG